jgi:serine/threonine protein kinase
VQPHTWDRVQEVYYSALPLSPDKRCAFVTQACDSDLLLTAEVCSLLKANDSADGFLDTPIFTVGLKIISGYDSTASSDFSDSVDELIATTIAGRYEVEECLASGGMARVYLARDLTLKRRRVVVKVLLDKSLRNERVVEKFEHEKEALASINHRGVVHIIDAGRLADEKPYLVMQYVEGISLRDALTARPEGMEFDRVASIIREIGAALNAVHEQQIYHRDLKPENIMLQRPGSTDEHIMVVDFGIARVTGSLLAPSTATGAATMGTVAYMSPEQLRGDPVGAASDLYSLGVIAYEMLTGRRPFGADTGPQLLEMQGEGVRVKPGDLRRRLPEKAQAIILRALTFDQKKRGPAVKEFSDRLAHALLTSEQVPAFSGGKPRPKRWLVFTAAAVLLAAVLTGAYWLASSRGLFGKEASSRSASSPHRTLNYSLTIQKMRDGLPSQDPFESPGQATVENGDKVRLNVSSRQAGYLYVFNEWPPQKNRIAFSIIYPTPATSGGSRLEQNQSMQTNWNTLSGPPGTEQFWIIWSEKEVKELEIARYYALKSDEGAITGDAATDLRTFLSEHATTEPVTNKDPARPRTIVRADGDLLVKRLQVEHR